LAREQSVLKSQSKPTELVVLSRTQVEPMKFELKKFDLKVAVSQESCA
jgi:hypothetical protein